MYVASDSPGLRSLLEAMPQLRGHATTCPAEGCGVAEEKTGTWRFPSQREAAELAADLWLLAAAEHTFAPARTTFAYWAARGGFGGGSRKQFQGMHITPAGFKMVPLCGPNSEDCVDRKPNYPRFALRGRPFRVSNGSACYARRFALLSPVAARLLDESASGRAPQELRQAREARAVQQVKVRAQQPRRVARGRGSG